MFQVELAQFCLCFGAGRDSLLLWADRSKKYSLEKPKTHLLRVHTHPHTLASTHKHTHIHAHHGTTSANFWTIVLFTMVVYWIEHTLVLNHNITNIYKIFTNNLNEKDEFMSARFEDIKTVLFCQPFQMKWKSSRRIDRTLTNEQL